MDIKIKTENSEFKYRVAGVIVRNDKVLIQKIDDNPRLCLPGGHVEIGESSKEAVSRELSEELLAPVEVGEAFVIHENFFNAMNKQYHEICMYYKAKCNECPEHDWQIVEMDKGVPKKLQYKWVTPEQLKDMDFRPELIKNKIINNDYSFVYAVSRD